MAYTLAEFAKLDLRAFHAPPEGELFLPSEYECGNCLGDGYITFFSDIFEDICQACQGTGVIL